MNRRRSANQSFTQYDESHNLGRLRFELRTCPLCVQESDPIPLQTSRSISICTHAMLRAM